MMPKSFIAIGMRRMPRVSDTCEIEMRAFALRAPQVSAKAGTSVYCADDEAAAFTFVKELVDLLPSNNAEGAIVCETGDDVNRVVDFDASAYTPEELIAKIADFGKSLLLPTSTD